MSLTASEEFGLLARNAGASVSAVLPWGEFIWAKPVSFPGSTLTLNTTILVNVNPQMTRRKLYFSISIDSGLGLRFQGQVVGLFKGRTVFSFPHEHNIGNEDFRLDVAPHPSQPAATVQVDDEPILWQIPNINVYASALPLRLECVIDTFALLMSRVDVTIAANVGGFVACYSEYAIGKADRRL